MKEAAKVLDFERAAQLRDMIFELKSEDWTPITWPVFS